MNVVLVAFGIATTLDLTEPKTSSRSCSPIGEGERLSGLQPSLYFFDLSGNGVIADNASFKIPNLARSEVRDSVSYVTNYLSVLIEQLYYDNQIREPALARICYRARNVA